MKRSKSIKISSRLEHTLDIRRISTKPKSEKKNSSHKIKWVLRALCSLLFLSQCISTSGQTQTAINRTDESCLGNAEVEVILSNTSIGAHYEIMFFYTPGALSPTYTSGTLISTGADIAYTFSGLQDGDYQITVDSASNAIKTIVDTILDVSVPVTMTYISTYTCSGWEINPTFVTGFPSSYSILDHAAQSIGLDNLHVDSIATGININTVILRSLDDCGNTVDIPISLSEYSYDYNTQDISYQYKYTGCSAGQTSITYQYDVGNNNVTHFDGAFPVTVTNHFIKNGTTDTTTVGPFIISNTSNYKSPSQTLTLQIDENYNLVTTVVDQCGNSIVGSPKSFTTKMSYSLQSRNTNLCGKKFLRVQNLAGEGPGVYYMHFLQVPSGFNPENYHSEFSADGDGDSLTGTFTSNVNNTQTISFGGSSTALPDGFYELEISDDCGRSVKKSVTLTTNGGTASANLKRITPGCGDNSTIAAEISGSRYFHKTLLTSAPTPWLTKHALSMSDLPVRVDSFLTPNKRHLKMAEMTEGVYDFDFYYTCDTTDKLTFSHTVPNSPHGYGFDSLNIEKTCAGFNLVGSFYTKGSNFTLAVQIESSPGNWTSPVGAGSQYNIFTGAGSQSYSTTHHPFSTAIFIQSGQYRIIYSPKVLNTSSNNINSTLACEYEVLEEINIEIGQITLNDYFVFECAPHEHELLLDINGVAPYTYIINSEDNPYFVPDTTLTPIFEGLEKGLYSVNVKDGCGAQRTFYFFISQPRLPSITPFNLCNGSTSGYLKCTPIAYAQYKWTKGSDTTALGTSNILNFTTFNDNMDTGLYKLTLSSFPPGACFDGLQLSYYVPAGLSSNPPNAGTGDTAYVSSDIDIPVNLRDYINGPFDSWGSFTETTVPSSGLEFNGLFYASQAGPGTYTFEYKVDGACVNSDVTTVTVIATAVSDLEVKMRFSETAPTEGDSIKCFITIKNNGPNHVTTAKLDDVIPTGLTLTSNMPDKGSYINDTWNIGGILVGEVLVLELDLLVDQVVTNTTITNTTSNLTSNLADIDITNNVGSATILVVNDFDGDGLGYLEDIDDDNDGILDAVEVTCSDIYAKSLVSVDALNATGILENGTNFTVTLLDSDNDLSVYSPDCAFSSSNFYQSPSSIGSFGIHVDSNQRDAGLLIIDFENEVENPIISIAGLENAILDFSATPKLSISKVTGNTNLDATSTSATVFDTSEVVGIKEPDCFISNQSESAYGTIRLNGKYSVIKINLLLTDANNLTEKFKMAIGEFECFTDTDKDGIVDRLDLDSDNDGIADLVEAGGIDLNNDGAVDYPTPGDPTSMLDANGNGWSSVFDDGSADASATEGGTPLADPDTDSDGHKNRMDIDSDDDGIADVIESQPTKAFIPPTGNDTDGDGIDDAFDSDFNPGNSLTASATNTDGTDNPDYLDADSDNDGESDFIEAYDLNDNGSANISHSGLDADMDGMDDIFELFNLILAQGAGTNSANGTQTANSFPNTDIPGGEPNWRQPESIPVFPRVFLEGPYNTANDNMDNALGTGGTGSILAVHALTQPYNVVPWNYAGTETVDTNFFVTNTDIVDWVLIELRDKTDSTNIVARRAGLVKQSGDIIDIDGVTGLSFEGLIADDYFISVRHRNHLGVMGASLVTLDANPLDNDIDFTTTTLYGDSTAAIEVEPGINALHMGNANHTDNVVKFTGSNNDKACIGLRCNSSVNLTNTVHGYNFEDIDLDGITSFTGSGNDKAKEGQKLQTTVNLLNCFIEQLP